MRLPAKILIATLILAAGGTYTDNYRYRKNDPRSIDTLVTTPKEDFLARINEDYQEHKGLVDNWMNIMIVPMGKRAIIDKNTLDILDMIPNTTKARRDYMKKVPASRRADLKTVSGRDSVTMAAFGRFDRYKDFFDSTFSSYGVPIELTYLTIIESNVSVITSPAGAQAYWQLMKSTKGNLIVNRKIDERNSIVLSTQRAAQKLRGLDALFGHYMLDATCYIRGQYGVASELEKMLKLNRQGELFKSYSDVVFFHAPYDHKILDRQEFWKIAKKLSRSNVFRIQLAKYSKQATAPDWLYQAYLKDVRGEDSTYVKSFWNFHGLSPDPKGIYWRYHDFLKKTKNNFSSPNYVPYLLAAIKLYNSDFGYTRQKPLKIAEFTPTKESVKEYYKDKEFMELNRHIKPNDLKNGNIPADTKVFRTVE